MKLNYKARETIKSAELTISEYCRHHGAASPNEWRGDACGCPDDRCKDGFHHEPHGDCGCLPVLIGQVLEARAREAIRAAEAWNRAHWGPHSSGRTASAH